MASKPLAIFAGVGVELEYMIVDRDTLDVKPICDRALAAEAGEITSEVSRGDIDWSNELVLHVIELKTSGPVSDLPGQAPLFQRDVRRINELIGPMAARLMPTAMHPWMDPHAEMRLWPHEYNRIYAAFNRIFDCTGHGWANLQAVHINLPFADDDQFVRLHAAIRLLMPIMPALAAASPVMDGRVTGFCDNRLANYKTQCRTVPSLTGRIIPEPISGIGQYHDEILRRIYDDLAPHDADGVLQHEWANARGAIARFDRNTIEIRVLDVQECPAMDVAVAAAVVQVLKLLVAETWGDVESQNAWAVDPLVDVFQATMRRAEQAVIENTEYLRALGVCRGGPQTAGAVWRRLLEAAREHDEAALAPCAAELDVLLDEGPLARRMLVALGDQPTRGRIVEVYGELCECLEKGAAFR